MKKTALYVGLFLLTACGSGGGKTAIDTGDVKGSIEAPGAEMKQGTLHTNEATYQQAIFEYGDHEIRICPTPKTFEELTAELEESNDSFNVEMSEVDKGADYIFYREKENFAGKQREGYRFLIYKKGKSKNYVLKGGGDMLGAIPTKDKAENAFKAAKTFEPAD
ncbi:MAG TPA: hypothetical protein VD905_22145 [Flavobacteriales bacterium]|nr:hypothetical protein [Flavobacteriales bacterium]